MPVTVSGLWTDKAPKQHGHYRMNGSDEISAIEAKRNVYNKEIAWDKGGEGACAVASRQGYQARGSEGH